MGEKGTERKPRAAPFRSLARLFARPKCRDPCSVGHERRSVSARDGSRRPPKNGNSGRQSLRRRVVASSQVLLLLCIFLLVLCASFFAHWFRIARTPTPPGGNPREVRPKPLLVRGGAMVRAAIPVAAAISVGFMCPDMVTRSVFASSEMYRWFPMEVMISRDAVCTGMS